MLQKKIKSFASSGNRTRAPTLARLNSTTRPMMLYIKGMKILFIYNILKYLDHYSNYHIRSYEKRRILTYF